MAKTRTVTKKHRKKAPKKSSRMTPAKMDAIAIAAVVEAESVQKETDAELLEKAANEADDAYEAAVLKKMRRTQSAKVLLAQALKTDNAIDVSAHINRSNSTVNVYIHTKWGNIEYTLKVDKGIMRAHGKRAKAKQAYHQATHVARSNRNRALHRARVIRQLMKDKPEAAAKAQGKIFRAMKELTEA